MYEVCVNTPGHYKCECARFFRRDSVSGQCQPDPAIYSQYSAPQRPAAKEAKKEEKEGKNLVEMSPHDREDHERYLEAIAKKSRRKVKTDDDDELSEEDIKRLVVAVVICIIGTAAAKGSIFWNLMFFLSIILAGIWWASDKTDLIARSLLQSHTGKKQEL